MIRHLAKGLMFLLLGVIGLAFAYAVVPVYVTPLMIIRLVQGNPWHGGWTPLSQIPVTLPQAAIAAEDNLFCSHNGFDFAAINKALEADNGHGASTISQQTAKNVFLWPGRTWVRKGLEVPLTLLIETLWGKQRIMEVYLNVAEFGPGVYGVGAAARQYFHTTPRKLTRRQAARLVAVLPNPRHWSVVHPGPYVAQRAGIIARRSGALGVLDDCIRRH